MAVDIMPCLGYGIYTVISYCYKLHFKQIM